MSVADFIIVGIVSGRDLNGSGSEIPFYHFVTNDRHLSVKERVLDKFPMQMFVPEEKQKQENRVQHEKKKKPERIFFLPGVLGMYCYSSVPKHGLDTCGSDDDFFVRGGPAFDLVRKRDNHPELDLVLVPRHREHSTAREFDLVNFTGMRERKIARN